MSDRVLKSLVLSSESESDNDAEDELFLYCLLDNKVKSPNKNILLEREKCGQFMMTKKMNDRDFFNYLRMNQNQFAEVHGMIQQGIDSKGCHAQQPIPTEEKLAVFLR